MKNKNGFSLVEVIIATSIITVTVFGIYKLLSENTKLVEISTHNFTVNNLFSVLENCIEYKDISTIQQELFLDLGNHLETCNFQTSIVENKIDDVYYTLSASYKTSSKSVIFWDTKISSDYIGTKTGTYVQKK